MITHKKQHSGAILLISKWVNCKQNSKTTNSFLPNYLNFSILHTVLQFHNISKHSKPRFYVFVGTTYNGIISGKFEMWEHFSYRHLARPIQKVHKITENTKYGNIKSGLYCTAIPFTCPLKHIYELAVQYPLSTTIN
jgi:hypothetical protein